MIIFNEDEKIEQYVSVYHEQDNHQWHAYITFVHETENTSLIIYNTWQCQDYK